jgi:hypothetical protein
MCTEQPSKDHAENRPPFALLGMKEESAGLNMKRIDERIPICLYFFLGHEAEDFQISS